MYIWHTGIFNYRHKLSSNINVHQYDNFNIFKHCFNCARMQEVNVFKICFCRELIHKLEKRGCAIFLVSGGMLEIILPVALKLGISKENIFANRLKYYFDGQFILQFILYLLLR